MYHVKSLDSFTFEGRGTVFIIESPATAKRNSAAMRKSIGERINIDGVEYFVKGFDMHLPATPVSIGERIAIWVTKV